MKRSFSVLALLTCALFQSALAEENKGIAYDHCVQEATSRMDDCTGERQVSKDDTAKPDPAKPVKRESTCVERWQKAVADCDRYYKG